MQYSSDNTTERYSSVLPHCISSPGAHRCIEFHQVMLCWCTNRRACPSSKLFWFNLIQTCIYSFYFIWSDSKLFNPNISHYMHFSLGLVFCMGGPGVFLGHPWPYLRKTIPEVIGMGNLWLWVQDPCRIPCSLGHWGLRAFKPSLACVYE